MSEKKDLGVGAKSENVPEAEPSTADVDDYPQGATLAFIIVALAMSMFLVALDMVRQTYSFRQAYILLCTRSGVRLPVWPFFCSEP